MIGVDVQAIKTRDILPLTGLRFFAALFVCIAHIAHHCFLKPNDPLPWWLDEISRLSASGMTLFFVLSGFVIHYNYSKSIVENPGRGIYNFFVARFARLFPLYLVFLLGDVLIIKSYKTIFHPAHTLESIPYYLTLTQSWFYKIMGTNALIYQHGQGPAVSWSISTEWFFYFCYPFICFAILRMRKISTKLIVMLLLSIAAISFVATASLHLNEINRYAVSVYGPLADFATYHGQDSFFRWLVYFSPYSRVTEFILGVLTAAVYLQVSKYPISKNEAKLGLFATIACLLIAGLTEYLIFNPPQAGAWTSWIPNLHMCFGFAPIMAAIIFCCSRYSTFITKALSNRVIQWGGEISYSMYLMHLVILHFVLKHVSHLTDIGFIKLVLAFMIIVACSSVTFLTIETPARRIIRKLLTKKRAVFNETELQLMTAEK